MIDKNNELIKSFYLLIRFCYRISTEKGNNFQSFCLEKRAFNLHPRCNWS